MLTETGSYALRWLTLGFATALVASQVADAWGQSPAATAAQARPALSGAQGGVGAQAGLPQGGLAVQDRPAQIQMPLRRPGAGGTAVAAAPAAGAGLQTRPDSLPARQEAEVKPLRSDRRKAQRALQRSAERARRGVAPVDASR